MLVESVLADWLRLRDFALADWNGPMGRTLLETSERALSPVM